MTRSCQHGLSALKSLLAGKGVFYSPGCELPKEKGSYVLLLKISEKIHAKTKYGPITLQEGIYAYVGSAFGAGGIRARVSRHWREEKKIHWHIDWITTSEHCQHIGAWIFPGERIESELSRTLAEKFPAVPGFGASDSEEDSHLFKLC